MTDTDGRTKAFFEELTHDLESRGELIVLWEAKCTTKEDSALNKEVLPAGFRIFTYKNDNDAYYLITLDEEGNHFFIHDKESNIILGLDSFHETLDSAMGEARQMYDEVLDWKWEKVETDQLHLNPDQDPDD